MSLVSKHVLFRKYKKWIGTPTLKYTYVDQWKILVQMDAQSIWEDETPDFGEKISLLIRLIT